MGNLKTWSKVANGSRLVMSVSATAGKIVTAFVRCVDDESEETEFGDAELQPGPAQKRLSTRSDHYSVRVTLVFADECTPTFHAEIVKPSGKPHGKPFDFTVTGTAGDVKRATIVCAMQR
jgi:hypothetical protein